MSIPTALQFIQQVRNNASLRQKLQELGPEATLDHIVGVAARVGFNFTTEELQRAYKYDWAMRWARYQSTNIAASDSLPSNEESAPHDPA